jgi:hypothetical protein
MPLRNQGSINTIAPTNNNNGSNGSQTISLSNQLTSGISKKTTTTTTTTTSLSISRISGVAFSGNNVGDEFVDQ